FILAFLFKSFVAEMFVIPTGSMAPTLQGRHKDLRCPQCGFRYRTGASEEVDTETGEARPNNELRHTFCPLCRYEHIINPKDWKDNSYNGDRIVVGKFLYDFDEPK